MTFKRFLILSCTLLLAALIIASGFMMPYSTVTAQEPVPTTEPGAVPDGVYDPEAEARREAYEARIEAEYNSRSIFDFQIAYLIAEDAVTSDSLISGQSLTDLTGATVIHAWDEFVEQDTLNPFQIILIHDSIYEQIDTTRTQAAYRNKVILVAVDMPFEHLVEVTGDQCLDNLNPHIFEQETPTWLYFTYVADLGDESQREYVDQQELEACYEDYYLDGVAAAVQHGKTNMPIYNSEVLAFLIDHLVYKTIDYNITGNKRDAIPLPSSNLSNP